MLFSDQQQELWQRLEAHAFDDPAVTFPFSLRLAEENTWSLAFTRRALEEYRRFAFLAVAAGHPVSPSDAVDQVWHLHLLYTRDYWGEFCTNVLRAPLHHGPTRGGVEERDKFADWYGRTLASYRKFFGEPPADFWPATPSHPHAVRLDIAANWVVRKPRWWSWVNRGRVFSAKVVAGCRAAAGAALRRDGGSESRRKAAPTVAGKAEGMATSVIVMLVAAVAFVPSRVEAAAVPANASWPFGLRGPEFLEFFCWFTVAVFAVAGALRWYWRGPGAGAARGETLDGYEAAQLAGGEARVFAAVVANLCNRGLIEFSKGEMIRTGEPAPAKLLLLESVVLAAVRVEGSAPRVVREVARRAMAANAATLEASGLVVAGGAWPTARAVPLLLALAVPFVGAIKIFIGLNLAKPVGYLVVLSLLTLVLAFVAFGRRMWRTRRGDAVLEELRAEHARLATLSDAALGGAEGSMMLPLAVGLFGVGVLSSTALADVPVQLKPPRRIGDGADGSGGCSSTSSDSGGGGGGDGGGGGGDGGGGGGDGGGGGCGGCGGGGGD